MCVKTIHYNKKGLFSVLLVRLLDNPPGSETVLVEEEG